MVSVGIFYASFSCPGLVLQVPESKFICILSASKLKTLNLELQFKMHIFDCLKILKPETDDV